ncbi:MAG: ubiquinol-cytochrome C chaperone family protein [Nitratireductor sp.]
MAQARKSEFYTGYGFEDSVTGRFDVLALHMFLLSHRLAGEGSQTATDLAQRVFDTFTADTDRALREIGIGDTSVPKRKKSMIRGFYGQIDDFGDALTARKVEALEAAVAQRFRLAGDGNLCPLVQYMLAAADRLARMEVADMINGGPEWPDPSGPIVASPGRQAKDNS